MTLFEESLGLTDYVYELRDAFASEDKPSLQIAQVKSALARILEDKELLKKVLERLAHDIHFVREQFANIFNNEIILWRDPEALFSLRMHIWAEGADCVAHDHNGFGILGCWLGKVWVENYELIEERNDYAKLKLKEKLELNVGDMTVIRAGKEGIHKVMWNKGEMAITLGAYSRIIHHKNYITAYDPVNQKRWKIYFPYRIQREWANALLKILEGA